MDRVEGGEKGNKSLERQIEPEGGCYTSRVPLDYKRGANKVWYFDTIKAFPMILARMEGDYQKLLVRKHKIKSCFSSQEKEPTVL